MGIVYLIWRASHFSEVFTLLLVEENCAHRALLYIKAMNTFRVKNDSTMRHISCSISCTTISPSDLYERQGGRDCSGGRKKNDWSRHSAPQRSITGYACRVMSTFQLCSRPLTQGHVRTVALGPLRKLDSYTVTVLKGLYCDTNAPPPVRDGGFFFFECSIGLLGGKLAFFPVSHLEMLVGIW